MSKDFEQAYKELAKSEIPDLWDRIEAGLSEKSTPEPKHEQPPTEKKKIYFRKYTGMAAAVLCVALILPVAVFLRQQGQKSSKLEMTADQSSAEESGGIIECAPEAAEADGNIFDTAAGKTETTADRATDTDIAADVGEDAAADLAAVEESVQELMREEDKKMENSVGSASAECESAPKQRKVAELEDGAAIEKVTVDVMEETGWSDGSESTQSMGTVYTAVVLKDESGYMEEGEQIEILVPAHSSLALIEGGTFEIDLVYRENKEYLFELKVIR